VKAFQQLVANLAARGGRRYALRRAGRGRLAAELSDLRADVEYWSATDPSDGPARG
jgi:hypothetical protein